MQVQPVGNAYISKTAPDTEDSKLRKACQDFETIFNDMVFKAMRKTISKNDLFGSSKEEEMFTDMLDSKISEDAAADSSSGIGAMLYRQLTTNLKIDSIDKKGDIK